MSIFNKKWKFLKFIQAAKMRTKLIISFLALFIIPVLIIETISYGNYSETIEKNTSSYVSQLLVSEINKLDEVFSTLRNMTMIPLYLTNIQSVLESDESFSQKSAELQQYLGAINRDETGQYTTYLFDSDGNAYTSKSINVTYSREDTHDFYRQIRDDAAKAQGKMVILGPTQITDISGKSKYVLTVARDLLDITTPTYESIGMIAIDVDFSVFDSAVQSINEIAAGNTTVIDANNKIIFSSEPDAINTTLDNQLLISEFSGKTSYFTLKEDDRQVLCIYAIMPNTGWKMFVTIPTDELYKDAINNRQITLNVLIATVLLAVFIYTLLAFTITNPLKKMAALMKKVQDGNMDVQFNVKYNDEIGFVASNFNLMVRRVKELIQEVYLTKIRKQQAEFEMLQLQINPHFIFNTLETVRMLAVLDNENEIATMTATLGGMLRYNISGSKELVTIRDELEQLKNYIYLQNLRFSNKFVLHIQIGEPYQEVKILKMLFQPIVENSIMHGLEQRKTSGNITISIEETIGVLLIKVSDDGIGINAELLEQINCSLSGDLTIPENQSGIGLRNVNERIKLYYGEAYGLSVTSVEGMGTDVVARLPGKAKEDAPC